MCLPLCHKYSPWSVVKSQTINTISQEGYPLVYDVTQVRATQDRECSRCHKVQIRVVDEYTKSKEVRGSFH